MSDSLADASERLRAVQTAAADYDQISPERRLHEGADGPRHALITLEPRLEPLGDRFGDGGCGERMLRAVGPEDDVGGESAETRGPCQQHGARGLVQQLGRDAPEEHSEGPTVTMWPYR